MSGESGAVGQAVVDGAVYLFGGATVDAEVVAGGGEQGVVAGAGPGGGHGAGFAGHDRPQVGAGPEAAVVVVRARVAARGCARPPPRAVTDPTEPVTSRDDQSARSGAPRCRAGRPRPAPHDQRRPSRRAVAGGGKPAVYRQDVASKMIKVDAETHARLAELAAEHGTTLGGYVGELVGAQRTHAEWAAITAQTARYLREHFGFDPTPQEHSELVTEHIAIMDDLHTRFADRHGDRRTSA